MNEKNNETTGNPINSRFPLQLSCHQLTAATLRIIKTKKTTPQKEIET